ncbi:sensor histidine kinase [Bacillus sp. T33-2]|uniref:sensor histidine kinase n=1 Tax=Bacillus sp. T33-2 TaxID=2054168 RepID=UPI000C760112|nr:sensor histidine kinase [Bacillus sp. T33-2]PLR99247.1 hypothetical protein CVD19_02735 [Bacillus sp. T33-2]
MSEKKGVKVLFGSVEIAVFCFRILFYIFAFLDLYVERNTFEPYLLSVIWIFTAMLAPLCFWIPFFIHKRTQFVVAELLMSGSLAILVYATVEEYSSIFIMASLTIAFHLEKRYYWMLAVLALFPFMEFFFKGVNTQYENPYFGIFFQWLFLAIGFCLNLMITSYRKTETLNRIIEEQNQTLVQYAKQIETLTQVEERNRMARDLHDTLGHSFISYIMGLDAVSYLIDSNKEEAKKKIAELRDHTAASLEQIRETIHEIGAETDILLTSNFSAIIDEFSNYTNTKVSFSREGEEDVLHHPMRMALLRCLQECLTNAKRHGHATEISVCLSFRESLVRLIINDNGVGTDSVRYGFGLKSMKQRVEALNGELIVTSALNSGTTVDCQIPFRR